MQTEWKQQLENCITDVKELKKILSLTDREIEILEKASFKLTPYIAKLIRDLGQAGVKNQFIPVAPNTSIKYTSDYLEESKHQPIENLIHRYKNKVIVIATNLCACYCQFCTRQRITNCNSGYVNNLDEIINYIRKHPEVNDVLITGGDPLILKTDRIMHILREISQINTINVIRIGTRIPITLPLRIDNELVNALKELNNLYINIHINHPAELTKDSEEALLALANAGIPLGSQTVLLRGINDDKKILKELFEKLICIKVKPYYLYQCDKVKGCENFIVSPHIGIKIINSLCNEISGFALPKFVVDTPEAGKKVLAPCSLHKTDQEKIYIMDGNSIFVYSKDDTN